MYVSARSLDDLLHRVLGALLTRGSLTAPRKGKARELTGVLLKLSNPRARLSLAEKRSVMFGALGEFLWYLAKTKSLAFIKYYLPQYTKASDDTKTVWGGYGPRLFNMRGIDQIANVLTLLRKHPDSRRAAVQLFDANDLRRHHKDIPCTCALQFLVRDKKLHMFTMMRSNDAFMGLPHDIFAFTMIQEILARQLGVELGEYKHAVGSLHLYVKDESAAKAYLSQGWQEKAIMPPMPAGDPRASLASLLAAERRLRAGKTINIDRIPVDDYWRDLIRLLQVYRHFLDQRPDEIGALKATMASPLFEPLIEYKRTSKRSGVRPKHRASSDGRS